MNNKPLIKCDCPKCDCDNATADELCYECSRGLHATGKWKDGMKIRERIKYTRPLTTLEKLTALRHTKRLDDARIVRMKEQSLQALDQRNDYHNECMDLRGLLQEIKKYAIRDVFEGRKCMLCGGILGLGTSQEDSQHESDCPLLKIGRSNKSESEQTRGD